MPICTIYTSQGDKLATFSTDPFSSAITIGRSHTCTICLKGLVNTTISAVQILMSKSGFGWKAINKGRTGMYRDCVKVQETDLKEGDILRFAHLFLAFGDTTRPSAFNLTWTAPTEDGSDHAVLWEGLNSIGASHDNYVMIRTEDISRIHAFIRVTGNHVTIRSATLSNATMVNGLEIGDGEMEIKPSDSLQLAETPIKLVSTPRYSLSEAPIQVGLKKATAISNSDSVDNQNFMYLMLALFALLAVFIIFLTVRVLI